jgi:protein-disulfide isomerase
MNSVSLFLLRVVLACCCLFALGQPGQAQQSTDLATIEKQIDTLERQDRLILKKLDELERKAATGPGLNPTALTTTEVRGESFRGETGAKIAIIEYADFECSFCGQFERDTFPKILRDYIQTGKVRHLYRDLPLHHPHSMAAARASRCAGDQGKFWEMHDALFASQSNLVEEHLSEIAVSLGLDATKFSSCLASDKFTDQIQASASQADKLGLSATPAFIIGTLDKSGNAVRIDKRVVGAVPYETLKTDLDGLVASVTPAKSLAIKP